MLSVEPESSFSAGNTRNSFLYTTFLKKEAKKKKKNKLLESPIAHSGISLQGWTRRDVPQMRTEPAMPTAH